LVDVNGTTALVPLEPSPAPIATRSAPVTVSFQSTPDGQFLGFMNDTSWEPLNGTSTLLAVHQNPAGFAPDGVGFGAGDQLLVTADSIQVVDLRVVRVLVRIYLSRCLTRAPKDNLDDGDHPFHLHGHRPWMYVHDRSWPLFRILIRILTSCRNQNGLRRRTLCWPRTERDVTSPPGYDPHTSLQLGGFALCDGQS
jgi:hypothetical protein